MGLRPEHARLGAADQDGWPFEVGLVEMLGAERLVHGTVAGAEFTVRMDATLASPQLGDAMQLQFDAGRLHWFDAATRRRVG